MSNTIDLQDAAKTRFDSSTTEELQEYLTQLGETFDTTESQAALRKRALAALGLTDPGGAAVRSQQKKAVISGDPIRPPYNLTPNGLWGGRRHRVRLPRPEGSQLGRAEPVGWNGKATYWVAYDQVESIPEPILNVLQDRKRKHVTSETIDHPDGSSDKTTRFEFADVALVYMGVDPLTADRAGSLSEWYHDKGPGWFKKRNTREIQSIATLLEIPLHKSDALKTTKGDDDLLGDIFIFLYGYADVKDAKEVAA